jgi:superfamily I DNA/RNA helicase
VLGLTFTTKATAELDAGIRERAARGRAAARTASAATDEVEEPTVATYHSYAAGLLTEHGLRIGHEPDTRLIADAVALPARRARDPALPRPGAAPHRVPDHASATCSPSTPR